MITLADVARVGAVQEDDVALRAPARPGRLEPIVPAASPLSTAEVLDEDRG